MLQWIINQKNKFKMAAKGMVFLAAFLFLFFGLTSARAQQPASNLSQGNPQSELNQGVQIIQQPLGLPAVDIRVIIARIIRIALGLLGVIMLVLVLYAGFMWMTAGGNEEKIATAKKILTNAVIGLIIILSAYAIVSFVLNMLGLRGGAPAGPGAAAPNTQNFTGSGALGNIIKDHYPARDQVDVPRNTKIVITFRRPIKLDSFVQSVSGVKDANGDSLLGSCKNIGAGMNWQTDCDKLINMDNNHINITRADTGAQISGANVLANYVDGKVYTIVIRPYDDLGSASDPVQYLVHLGPGIKVDDPANNDPSAFPISAIGNNFYEWKFTCSTELDITPPIVLSVFPDNGSAEAKNSVIQIDFSEPMDPIGVEGSFSTTTVGDKTYFSLQGYHIFSESNHSSRPSGQFVLTNGYKTLEFTPDTECYSPNSSTTLMNACGGKLYCLPVCDDGSGCKQDQYHLLAQAAQTFNTSSFESIPFSGLEDLAGNAMDGNANTRVETATTTPPVFDKWVEPDNYSWQFTLKDEIDSSAPYLEQISPGLDADWVGAKQNWQMLWNKRMRVDPMYDIKLAEHPTPAERGDNIPLCLVPRLVFNPSITSTTVAVGATLTQMDHCDFLSGRRQYYYPEVTSTIEDAHFNCFYPGKGPGGDSTYSSGNSNSENLNLDYTSWTVQGSKHLPTSLICGADNTDCCPVSTSTESAFCCNGQVDSSQSTVSSCINAINDDSQL